MSTIAIIIWMILFAVFIVLEAITIQLVTIWFAVGALIAAIAAWLGAGLLSQTLLFVITTAIALLSTRKLVKKINPKTEPTNSDRYIGKKAIVTVPINNLTGIGEIKIGGVPWSAQLTNEEAEQIKEIPTGSIVRIKEIRGVKMIVEPEKK